MTRIRSPFAPGTLASMLVLAASLSAAAGCSTSKKVASTSTTAAGLAVPTTATASTSPAATTSTLPASSKLLSLNELPDGWSLDKSASGSSGDSPIKCLNKVSGAAKNGTTSHGSADFIKGTDLPTLSEIVANFKPGAASPAIASLASILDTCGAFKYTDSGTDLSGQIAPMKFSVAGLTDQHTYQISIHASVVSASGVLLFGRKGDTVMVMIYVDVGSPDLEAIRPIANSAVAKLG